MRSNAYKGRLKESKSKATLKKEQLLYLEPLSKEEETRLAMRVYHGRPLLEIFLIAHMSLCSHTQPLKILDILVKQLTILDSEL